MGIRSWLKRKQEERSARRALAEAFRSPEALQDTSLRPNHAARWVVLDFEPAEGKIARVRFGILRHPRPYAFSSQHHKVVEVYSFDLAARRITRLEGFNWTRARGGDAD